MIKMKKERKSHCNVKGVIVLFFMLVLVMVPSVPVYAKWVKTDKGYRYTTNASGTRYYKNKWVKLNGKYYYFDKKGYRKTGWLTYKGKKYYLSKSGVRTTGFKVIKNKKYYFSKKGIMITGWLKYQNNYYYLDKDGVVQTGLSAIGNYIYYFDASGKRVAGVNIVLGNMTYYFGNNGTLQYTGSEEEKAVKYINAKRMVKGYKPLTYYTNCNLSNAASLRAKELSVNASHTRPDGTLYSTVLSKEYPVSVYWSGECILWGKKKTGTEVSANWLSNRNADVLMQKEANAISIGSYTDDKGCEYWTVIVVQTK